MALSVDFSELEYAFGDQNVYAEHAWYLDTKTGDMLLVSDETKDDDLPLPRAAIAKDARFVRVEPREPRDGHRDMETFAASVADPALRERLTNALAGKGAFRRFKDTLLEAPAERERWFAFERERIHAHCTEWLAELGIDAEPR